VPFISIHSVIICVVFFGAYMRCTRLCPLNSGVTEAHKAKVEELTRKVAEATKKFEVEAVKHEIFEIERSRAQRNDDELRASKERCYEVSLECSRKLKDNFVKVGAYSSQ
jgi:hypothetical protein